LLDEFASMLPGVEPTKPLQAVHEGTSAERYSRSAEALSPVVKAALIAIASITFGLDDPQGFAETIEPLTASLTEKASPEPVFGSA
jgi:hypothetical protein